MAIQGFYQTDRLANTDLAKSLPRVSDALDSFRTYQWEIQFRNFPRPTGERLQNPTDLTLAAKKVQGLEISGENKTVDRVNDRLNYPGKATLGELVVTFDNLYDHNTAVELFEWFKTIYDPVTGAQTIYSGRFRDTFKCQSVQIVELDNNLNPAQVFELYGVYPTKWSMAELNYSTSDMQTVEMSFKYDFMDAYRNSFTG